MTFLTHSHISSHARLNSLALFVILAVITIFYVIKPTLKFSPRGILLPGAIKSLPSQSNDNVHLTDDFPATYQTLGRINIESLYRNGSNQEKLMIIHYAKKLAADYGANGLVITRFGYTPPETTDAALSRYSLQATAVYTQVAATPFSPDKTTSSFN